ncbi:MAG: hypothetical protein QXG39_00160 [Candidatus Aenigmatarchaeota archaeon]
MYILIVKYKGKRKSYYVNYLMDERFGKKPLRLLGRSSKLKEARERAEKQMREWQASEIRYKEGGLK